MHKNVDSVYKQTLWVFSMGAVCLFLYTKTKISIWNVVHILYVMHQNNTSTPELRFCVHLAGQHFNHAFCSDASLLASHNLFIPTKWQLWLLDTVQLLGPDLCRQAYLRFVYLDRLEINTQEHTKNAVVNTILKGKNSHCWISDGWSMCYRMLKCF